MEINFFLQKNRASLLILALIIVIIFLILGILFFDSREKSTSKSSNLTSYESLSEKISSLSKDPGLANNAHFQKMGDKIKNLSVKTMGREEQFQNLKRARYDLLLSYSQTNDHKLYIFSEELDTFIKINFPEKNFNPSSTLCMDPTCAENPLSPEIKEVIDEVLGADIPQAYKEEIPEELTNLGYINNEHAEQKVIAYMIIANDIQSIPELKDTGLNLKLSQKIIDYVIKTYPEEYKNFQEGDYLGR